MNLWVRTLGQLAVLTVALFFFSCEDETSILGFKNPNKKFQVNFVDIPLPSDVFLVDSMRTSNFYGAQGETTRFLTGTYADEQFGNVSASAVTQFFTTSATAPKPTAVFDSVTLQLRFDFYHYGNQSATPQTISIHEVQQELRNDSAGYYFNRRNTAYDPNALGTKTFAIVPVDFDKFVDEKIDTAISITIPLDPAFGQRIFDSALRYRSATTAADSAFVKFTEFIKEFKGIAIVPESGDKIVGFNPAAAASMITLHYHDVDADSLKLNLAFERTLGYSVITADRSSTELAAITEYSQPFQPSGNKRYVQAGTGILTRLDFQGFYDFVDADTNSAVVVNSAELLLGPAESGSLPPIKSLALLALRDQGHLKKVSSKADTTTLTSYNGKMGVTGGFFSPLDADGNVFTIQKNGDNDYYNGFLTLFAQEFFKGQEKDRFRYFALYPTSPQAGKSVNRSVFHEENIRLRLYYTRPAQPIQ
ncbi:MAG TPA: DUF4270 family protein [Chryseosolibacter sp.]